MGCPLGINRDTIVGARLGKVDRLEKNGDCLPVWRLPERMKEEGLVHDKSVAIYSNRLPLSHNHYARRCYSSLRREQHAR